jgi:hypothetical protein
MERIPSCCEHFKPRPTASWLCAWYDSEETEAGIEWFCSRPSWDYRTCETQGLPLMPEAQLIQNVKAGDVGVEG